VFDIDREHPEYTNKKSVWQMYRDLYAGGEALKRNAASYLVQRHKEPADVYAERLGSVFYENYLGSIIDWYAATVFRREPVLSFEGANDAAKRFFYDFTGDCDLRGTDLTDFLRASLVDALVEGSSFVLVDFPRARGMAGSRAEEDLTGRSRAYLIRYSAQEVINWSHDERGDLEWAIVRTRALRQSAGPNSECQTETHWTYFDRRSFQKYRRTQADGSIELVDKGLHGLARQNRVPLFELTMQDGFWLANKAGLLQLEHFNKSNALSWALTMGLFAMPVIYSERTWNQIIGESYYIQLSPGDRFGWAEPEGKVYQIAADNLQRLQEEIYRVCYLSQAGAPLSGQVQSAMSKLRDFAITQEVLRAYGDAVKDLTRKMLRAIEEAREDGIDIQVSGLDEFDIQDFSSELEDAQRLLGLGIDSPTLKKQVFKKLALKYLCDARQDVKGQIATEIDGTAGGPHARHE
jgi:hypothetical protein